ncbi:MAG: hypothetical protein ACI4U5_01450 [Bacilli bacterium]
MRRFFGYLVIIFTVLAIALFDIQPQVEKVNSGLEITGGYEIVYRVDDYDQNKNDIFEITKQVDKKLEKSGVKNYTVSSELDETASYYQVRIRMGAKNTTSLNYALKSVESTGSITVSTLDNSGKECGFKRGTAKVNYAGSTPYVEVEVDSLDDWTTLQSDAKTAYEKWMKDHDQDTSESEITGIMIVWMDKAETDSYVDCIEETSDGIRMRNKILSIVPVDYFDKDKGTVKIASIGVADNAENLTSESAHTIERIINGEEYEYKLTKLYSERIEPTAGSYIQPILIISSCVLVLGVAIYLVAKYGLAGLTGFTAFISSLFVDLLVFNLMSYTLTTLSFLGFIAAGLLSLTMIVNYLDKFKNELYKGRNAAKANIEAFRQALPTTIDLTLISLLISIVSSYVATNEIRMMPVVMIIGSLLSIIVTLLVTKICMYWLANSKIGLENKKVFAIKEELIPDVSKNESQKKFSFFKNTDFKKGGKRNFIIGMATSLVSVIVVLTLFLVPSVKTFNYTNDLSSCGKINITTQVTDILDDESKIRELIEKSGVDIEITDIQIGIGYDVVVDGEENTVDEVDYICITTKNPIEDDGIKAAIESVLNSEEYDEAAEIAFMSSVPNDPTNKVENSIVCVAVFSALAIAYFTIRYKYTYGIASLATLLPTGAITIGLMAATRIPVNSLALSGVLLVVYVTALSQVSLFNRIKRLKRESKVKVTTYEQKEEIILNGAKDSMNTVLIITVITALIGVCLCAILPNTLRVAYAGVISASIIATLANRYILIPVLLFSEKHFSIRKLPKDPEKAKAKLQKRAKKARAASNEPEESIIPGIND